MDADIASASAVRRELRRLHDEVADKADADEVDELRRDLRSTAEEVALVEERHTGHEAALDGLGRDLRDEIAKTAAKLDRRLVWLERHVRASGGAITATLDPEPELVELARRAERGRLLQAQLLDTIDRDLIASAIQRWETWQNESRTQREAALNASRRIAGTAPAAPARERAVREFRTARGALATLDERRAAVAAAARRAQLQMTRDDTLRADHSADIGRGAHDWTTLTTRLRTRLVDTIDKGHLLPIWFATVLGMSPPPDAADWLEVGTDVLAYRATYEVTDPVVALGPPVESLSSSSTETSRALAERRAWQVRLTHRFRDYR